jgi:hypothetical protein
LCVFSGFERKCNICNKTVTSTTQKGVNNNFHKHMKVHNLSAKEYKAIVNPVALPVPQPPVPQYQYEPGFGDDGGFEDRGAFDERYQDVPDDADGKKVNLAEWFASTDVRQLLVNAPDL